MEDNNVTIKKFVRTEHKERENLELYLTDKNIQFYVIDIMVPRYSIFVAHLSEHEECLLRLKFDIITSPVASK